MHTTYNKVIILSKGNTGSYMLVILYKSVVGIFRYDSSLLVRLGSGVAPSSVYRQGLVVVDKIRYITKDL